MATFNVGSTPDPDAMEAVFRDQQFPAPRNPFARYSVTIEPKAVMPSDDGSATGNWSTVMMAVTRDEQGRIVSEMQTGRTAP